MHCDHEFVALLDLIGTLFCLVVIKNNACGFVSHSSKMDPVALELVIFFR